ncbi:Avirulence protein (Avh) [Phytophthora palmivora]|uniref:RxLR effector protein n=1 Tax=Phytophthora palmivora TaxID=4796 RepID=A0A2P4YB43_9STRA|nr:Avirulence protein (Avh) [Phytophthora palmivora]
MRLSYFILLIGGILTTSSAISNFDQTTIAKAVSPDQDRLLNTDLNNAIHEKRFLRSKPTNYDGSDEERFWINFKVSKLEDILTNENKQLEKFAKWKNKKIEPADVTKRIRAYMPNDERYWGLGLLYRNYLEGKPSTVTTYRLDDDALKTFTVRTDSEVARANAVANTGEGTSGITSYFWNWWTR